MKKNPTARDVLVRMRTLLRKGWTQGGYARARNGHHVDYESTAAVRFCLLGASRRATSDLRADCGYQATALIRRCLPAESTGIVGFNDAKTTKKTDVLKVVNCAIKKAESKVSA